MSDDTPHRRAGERRTGAEGYDGPERRVADRRIPEGAPTNRPDASLLSDIDLLRACHRLVGEPEAAALRAEAARRGLEP